MTAVRYIARFQPEAWLNDCAIAVDPDGPTEWDCTAFVTPDVRAYLDGCVKRRDDDLTSGVLDDDDVFIDDPAAPEWVRRWRGPFTIQVFQARAATITTDDEYGEEVVVRTEDGRELRSRAGADGDCTVTGEYVRVLDAAGREQGYWTSEEWREDPEVVMGAIVGCLLGLGDQARAVTNAGARR